MASYIDPLDFATIFLNYFLGNQILFVSAFIIVISYACAYFQMSNKLYLILLTIGGMMFASYLGQGIYFLIIFFVGFLVFRIFASWFNR